MPGAAAVCAPASESAGAVASGGTTGEPAAGSGGGVGEVGASVDGEVAELGGFGVVATPGGAEAGCAGRGVDGQGPDVLGRGLEDSELRGPDCATPADQKKQRLADQEAAGKTDDRASLSFPSPLCPLHVSFCVVRWTLSRSRVRQRRRGEENGDTECCMRVRFDRLALEETGDATVDPCCNPP